MIYAARKNDHFTVQSSSNSLLALLSVDTYIYDAVLTLFQYTENICQTLVWQISCYTDGYNVCWLYKYEKR